MADKSKIEWTEATWNPIRGCSRVSEGCRHCYAEAVAARFSGPGMPYEGLAKRVGGEARWTGEVRMVPEHLADPLRWKRPRRVFVNSMSDLFHERLPDDAIAAVFGVMAAAKKHTFQVLTKRPERARQWFSAPRTDGLNELLPQEFVSDATHRVMGGRAPGLRHMLERPWPLPNVWLGVSAENQETADQRIPLLLQCPAAVRFVSYEPALGPVDFGRWINEGEMLGAPPRPEIHWIIVGGESGPEARPFDVSWARSTVAQCRIAEVACFVKQLGAVPVMEEVNLREWPTATWVSNGDGRGRACLNSRKGGDPDEWPLDLRVRRFPKAAPAGEAKP